MGELPFCRAGLVDTKPPIGRGQGCTIDADTPRPTHRGSHGENSQRRIGAAQKAAHPEARPSPVDPRVSPHPSPVRFPPAPPGGANARCPSGLGALEVLGRALEDKVLGGLATLIDGRAANETGSMVGGGRVPLREPPVSHWLLAVSLGTWRRSGRRPFSGEPDTASGPIREVRWTEPRGAGGASGPLDRCV